MGKITWSKGEKGGREGLIRGRERKNEEKGEKRGRRVIRFGSEEKGRRR